MPHQTTNKKKHDPLKACDSGLLLIIKSHIYHVHAQPEPFQKCIEVTTKHCAKNLRKSGYAFFIKDQGQNVNVL
jgi:hypothetical protein